MIMSFKELCQQQVAAAHIAVIKTPQGFKTAVGKYAPQILSGNERTGIQVGKVNNI